MTSSGPIGYMIFGTQGKGRHARLGAYYHRIDNLRLAADRAGYTSLVQYNRRSDDDRSSLRRLARSAWVRTEFGECAAVYGGAADANALAAWALRKTNVPVLYDVHTPPVGERWLYFRMHPNPRSFMLYIESIITELISIKKSDHLLWSSLIQQQYYQRRGFPPGRTHEVRHGVDLGRFDFGPPPEAAPPLLCYAGSMLPYQGAEKLVEAYEKIGKDKLRLRMIGFEEVDEPLRLRAKAAGAETLRLIPHEQLPEQMRDCHGTVITAHPDNVKYKNGAAPTKWPESLAIGRPVISVDAYDTAQLIRDLKVGWVVENSATGLEKGLRALAASSISELREMGQRARAEAERNYGWESIGERYVGAIRRASKR